MILFMKKLIGVAILVVLLAVSTFNWYLNKKLHEKPAERYTPGTTHVSVKRAPHQFSKEDADYIMLEGISFDDNKVILTVREGITKMHETLPPYFNKSFNGKQITISVNADLKQYRFKPAGKLQEQALYKNFAFLYAYPAVDYKNGSYKYRFVYVSEILPDRVDLRVSDGGLSENSVGMSWSNFTMFRVTKEQAEKVLR